MDGHGHDGQWCDLRWVDMALDEQQRPWVCAWDTTGSDLLLRTPLGGHADDVITTGARHGEGCALAVSHVGLAHVAYVDAANQTLRIARDDGTGGWHSRAITEGVNVSPDLELALFSDTAELILWRDADTGHLHASRFTGSYWDHLQVTESVALGGDVDLVIDNSDVAHIAYGDANGDIRLIRWSPASDERFIVDRGPGLGASISVALQPDGTAMIAYATPNGTAVRLLTSIASQATDRLSTTPWVNLTQTQGGSEYGWSVASGSDLDKDGRDDLVIGAPGWDGTVTDGGAVFVHYGRSTGYSSTPDVTLLGDEAGARFGHSVLTPGDLDGDGWPELVVGATHRSGGGIQRGSVLSYSSGASGLATSPGWQVNGSSNGAHLGWALAGPDVDADGRPDLVASQPDHSVMSLKGQILAWETATSFDTTPDWSADSAYGGVRFGIALIDAGDIDNDGDHELAVSATGDLTDPGIGRGRVVVYEGDSTGLSSTPDIVYQLGVTRSLFGYALASANINGDSYDDLIIGEPDNSSAGSDRGQVWAFTGSSSGLGANASWTRTGGVVGDRFGAALASLGDLNGDGDDDLLITSLGASNQAGQVQVLLATGSGGFGAPQGLVRGVAGQRLGRALAFGGDADGDGIREAVITSSNASGDHTGGGFVHVLPERTWGMSDIALPAGHSIDELTLLTDIDGRTQLIVEGSTPSSALLHGQPLADVDGRPGWAWESLLPLTSTDRELIAAGGFAGRPTVLVSRIGADTLTLLRAGSSRALSQTIASIDDVGHYSDTQLHDGQLRIAHVNATGTIRLDREGGAGWSNEIVAAIDLIDHPVRVRHWNGSEIVVFRDAANDTVLVAHDNGSAWVLDAASGLGQATGAALDAEVATDGVIHIVMRDGSALGVAEWNGTAAALNVTNVSGVMTLNASHVAFQEVHAGADDGTLVDLMIDSLGHRWLARVNNSGDLQLWRNTGGGYASVFNGSASGAPVRPLLVDGPGAVALIAADRNGTGAVYSITEALGITSVSLPIAPAGTHALGAHLWHGSIQLFWIDMSGTLWSQGGLADDAPQRRFDTPGWDAHLSLAADADDRPWLALRETGPGDMHALHWAADADRDGAPEPWDGLPDVDGQWADADSDGYGDNSLAWLDDDCTSANGSSWLGNQGCVDPDSDGWGLGMDLCPAVNGSSWWDRQGCPDHDRDGWSDSDGVWQLSDKYPTDWKQAKDTDGDHAGDNHGPDVPGGDWFPLDASQQSDTDRDGFGDNPSRLATTPDACRTTWGNSTEDRYGCPDSDGDGWSDAGDAFPREPTQHTDTDMDGYGDNQSEGAFMPDAFVDEVTQWSDTDDDGYGDNWNETQDNATRDPLPYGQYVHNASQPDDCPGISGNSTRDRFGCPDFDGDGWSDLGDDLLFNPTQHLDRDGDGFGDDLNGTQADVCPDDFGHSDGADGQGCERGMDPDDTDADGVENGVDACPGTPPGAIVNIDGCADSQLDADDDGVTDDIDRCPNTPSSATVDEFGCDTTQVGLDPDGDGVPQSHDLCPGTLPSLPVDANGCSSDQRDTDGDGVVDAIDDCAGTPPGATVDSQGCILVTADADGDGVNDTDDDFPNDRDASRDIDGEAFAFLGLSRATLAAAALGLICCCLLAIIGIVLLVRRGAGRADHDIDDDEDSEVAAPRQQRAPQPQAAPQQGYGGAPPGGYGGAPQAGYGGPAPGAYGGAPVGGHGGAPAGGGYGGPPAGGAYGHGPRTDGYGHQEDSYGWNRPDQGLFAPGDMQLKEGAVRWTWEQLQQGANVHDMLHQLQQTGWNAMQARAILDEAAAWNN